MSRMTFQRAAGVFWTALVLCLTGCHHGGTAPPGWHDTTHTPADHQTSDASDGQGRLQVFICYGQVFSNHTALRLVAPGKPELMWDPGGTYKQADPAYARRYDVLTQNNVTPEQWWRYRRDDCREQAVEMFEWRIDGKQAERLHAILLTRQDTLDPSQTFEPDAGGLQCAKRVSEFLMRFADDRPDVEKRYFWPHNLAEHLWTQSPDRVVIFYNHSPDRVYIRAPDTPD